MALSDFVTNAFFLVAGAVLSFGAQMVRDRTHNFKSRKSACHSLRHKCLATVNSIKNVEQAITSASNRGDERSALWSKLVPVYGFRFRDNRLSDEELMLLGRYNLADLENTCAEVFEAEFVLFQQIEKYNLLRERVRDELSAHVKFDPRLPEATGEVEFSASEHPQIYALIVECEEAAKTLVSTCQRASEDAEKLLEILDDTFDNALKKYGMKKLQRNTG